MADITFQQLLLGTQRVLPTAIANKGQDMRVFNTRISNFEGTNMKVFNTNVMSSIGRKAYNISLAFYNVVDKSQRVEPEDIDATSNSEDINNTENLSTGYQSVFNTDSQKTQSQSNTVANAVPSLTTMRVGVRCSCSCYYFWCSYANTKAKCNYGARFRQYIRKTPPYPIGYPPKNPLLIPMVCKHIIHFVEELRNNGLVQ